MQEAKASGFENKEVLDAMSKIKVKEKDQYYCLCIRSRDSADKLSKVLHGLPRYANEASWRKMKQQIKAKLFNDMFGDLYNKVIVFHDPTIIKKPTAKKPDPTTEPTK